MPIQTPPPNPNPTPVVVQQQQQQQQYVPVSRTANDLFNGNSSNSVSNPTGVIRQESGIYNSQVNLNHDSYIGYGVGNTHPVPVFSGTMRWNPNYGDYELVAGFSFPLGGGSSKASERRLKAAAETVIIENRFRSLSGCYNVANAGYVINYALLAPDDPLHACKVLLASGNVIELPPPPVVAPDPSEPSLAELKAAWQFEARKMQMMIKMQQEQIDNLLRERGTDFNTPG